MNGVKLNSESSELKKSPIIHFFKILQINFKLTIVFSLINEKILIFDKNGINNLSIKNFEIKAFLSKVFIVGNF